MHLGRTILHLWLRKQHICVYQTKSICRENTVLKFLGLVSHSQGYGSALDCSTLTPLSASTPQRKLQIQSEMHVYDTYHIAPTELGGYCSEMLEAVLLFLEHLLARAGVDLSISLPSRAGATGRVPEVAAARTGMARSPRECWGSLLLLLLLGLSQTVPAKQLGEEKLPEGQTLKPGDDLSVWALMLTLCIEHFTPDPPHFSSSPI